MRHLALALVLACVLSGTALAGEIPTTGAVTPQPSSPVVTTGDNHPTASTVLTMILTLISIVR